MSAGNSAAWAGEETYEAWVGRFGDPPHHAATLARCAALAAALAAALVAAPFQPDDARGGWRGMVRERRLRWGKF